MKKNLLFVTYGGGHAHILNAVIDALQSSTAFNEHCHVDIVALTGAKPIFDAAGKHCHTFQDFLIAEQDADAIAWGKKLAEEHHSPTIGISKEASIAYLGLSYKDLVTRLGEQEAAQQFTKKQRHAFYPLTIMERIFDALKPDMVICTNSPRAEAAAIAVGNMRNIPTMAITDLFGGLKDYVMQAKHITMLNSHAQNMLIEDGLVDASISQLHLTGNPAFDALSSLAFNSKDAFLAEHFSQSAEALSQKRLVAHADLHAYVDAKTKASYSKTEAETLDELETVYAACRAVDAAYLVRPHPSQSRAFYASWVAQKEDAYLAADCPLHAWLHHCDVLIARSTTVSLEAVYMRRPVIQWEWQKHTDMPLADMGVAMGADNAQSLTEALRKLLNDNKAIEKLQNNANNMFPKTNAARKIANLILSIAAAH